MKTRLIFLFIFFFHLQNLSAQIGSSDKIYLGNWGYIYLPESMEIQSGIYKKVMDEAKKEFSVNAERVVFQQRGVNDGENLNTYARVIIRTDTESETLPNLNTEILTKSDLSELNSVYYSEVNELSNNTKFPIKIINWNPVKITTINGQKCINYSYLRKMGDNPITFSEFFIFWKGRKQHTINIEYRINETSKWKNILESCVKSLKFK